MELFELICPQEKGTNPLSGAYSLIPELLAIEDYRSFMALQERKF